MGGIELLQRLIIWLLWIYWKYCIYYFSVLTFLILIYKLTSVGSKINYKLFIVLTIYHYWLCGVLALPMLVVRPRHWQNATIFSWLLSRVSYVTGFTWEVRGLKYVAEDRGMVLCCNHQSFFDILGENNTCGLFGRRGTIGKKEILYAIPFGPCAWLCNLIFINRKNTKSAYQTLQEMRDQLTTKKMKILFYPEGTRNCNYGFLPFKKGAFITAIQAQVPIVPMVIAPYYYLDYKNGRFLHGNKHNILSILEPISTEGMTEANCEEIKDKVYGVMIDEYEKLNIEIKSKANDPIWLHKSRPRVTTIN